MTQTLELRRSDEDTPCHQNTVEATTKQDASDQHKEKKRMKKKLNNRNQYAQLRSQNQINSSMLCLSRQNRREQMIPQRLQVHFSGADAACV